MPLIAAAVFLTYPLWHGAWTEYKVNNAAKASQTKILSAAVPAAKLEGIPTRIIIPRFAIDLPIVPGSYDKHKKEWTVSDSKANYAVSSAPANNYSGQTLVYGHNNRAVLGPLLDGFQPRDKVYLHTKNGHVFEYEYTGSNSLQPSAVGILKELKNGTGLKIITCKGANFEYRHVMSFKLSKAV